VTKSSAVAFEDAAKASAADPSAPAPSPPELATLSAIVYISDENFWFTSCAKWRGPTTVSPSFANIKPSFTGQAPADDPVRADFPEVISNIKGLMAMASTPGFTTKRGVLVGAANDPMLKIRHQVFEVRFIFSLVLGYISHVSYLQKVDPSQPVDSGSETASESDSKYSAICRHILFNSYYSAWNVHYTRVAYPILTLFDLQDTHRTVPFPAYDMHGALIEPTHYERYLKNAVVRLHFTMSHWSIAAKKGGEAACDTFGADLHGIRVLVAPTQRTPVSPRKWKVFGQDPMGSGGSPTKKANTNLQVSVLYW
jgi:hypothetical protein